MGSHLPTVALVSIIVGALIGTAILVFWIVMIAVCCYKRTNVHSQTTVLHPTPVVVTSATHTAPGGYPVTQMPVGATTTAYQTQVYATPYPPQGVQQHMPMPMPTGQPPVAGVQPHIAPYPPMPAANMNPPSYDVAVSGAGAGQANNTPYGKQAPYNPNFQM